MPFVRTCAKCKKSFIMSTYQIVEHVERCKGEGKKLPVASLEPKKTKTFVKGC